MLKNGVFIMLNIDEKEIQKIFSDNLRYYLKLNNKTQLDLANAIGVSKTTINNYIKGYNTPRMDKVDKICNYLRITKSDLLEDKSKQKEIDIANMVNDLMDNLNSNQALMYSGELMGDVTKELVGEENKDQNVATEKDCSANTDAKFVSDVNVSDKQVVSGTDNKANLRELYYKDGYIYFKYIMAKNDEFSVGGVTYAQTNKAKFEVKLVEENPYVNPPVHPDDYELTEKDKYKGETTVTIEKFNEDFGRVYVGEIAEGEVYGGILARVATYYVAKDAYSNGLSMTRTVDYRNYMN